MESGKGALVHLRSISELIEIIGDAMGCFERRDAKVDANAKNM
jgi:hypothetical protein